MEGLTEPLVAPSLERATHALALWIERSLQDVGITQAEAHVLGALSHWNPCSINDLHASFGHKRSTLTSVLDRLESRGLVRRGAHPTSRRSVQISLTENGLRVAGVVSASLHELDGRITHRTEAGDMEAFVRVLTAIEESLE